MWREYFADKTPGIFVGTERSSLFISKYLQSGCSKWWVFLFCKLFHQASWGIVPKDLQCKRSETSHWAPLLVSAGFVLALIWCRSHSSSKTTENKWTMWCVMCDAWCVMCDAWPGFGNETPLVETKRDDFRILNILREANETEVLFFFCSVIDSTRGNLWGFLSSLTKQKKRESLSCRVLQF